MYDELVKRLNYCRNNAAVVTDSELVEIAEQAVDAIEELQDQIAANVVTIKRQSHIIKAKDKDLLRAIDAQARWIPVTERLPEYGKPVLLYFNRNNHNSMGVGDCYHDGDTLIWRGCGFIPTHWMPLPEPPKEET